MLKKLLFFLFCMSIFSISNAQDPTQGATKFQQLYQELPTPTTYRNAAGAPGHEYWQQRADYDMKIEIDDKKQRILGEETITYYNNSPDALSYLWIQLDQNVRALNSDAQVTRPTNVRKEMGFHEIKSTWHNDFDGGFKIESVTDKKGTKLNYTINKTMMRIDLDQPLKSKGTLSFNIKWWYNINDGGTYGGRSGYEFFPNEDNYMYHIAQFYPRMCAYNETDGWQNKQFLGRGEFTLSFGDYKVAITAPADHTVGATGVLQNAKEVLSSTQLKRLEAAKTADKPLMITTEEEAKEIEKGKSKAKKTWVFKAENVRDFGFCSSRKFIWDAQGVNFGNRTVMAMSYYPKEGNPLWEQYSTRAIVHTLKVYSKYTFDYPYPTAISTHANFTGMEYPMICFNFGRPRPDGSYSERLKYRMIGVIIHEVGHNYFPMIVNSDERQWTWMDEGLNTFLQYLTECEWERDFPSRRGPAEKIVDYMRGDKNNIVPIMSNSESILQFGNNAYGKPATALNILRETIMGRELFDHAFKEYSNRWKFKHPSPADFFRTMEDASGVDLDWFWRGWFYTTDHVDISIDAVKWYQLNSHDPQKEVMIQKKWDAKAPRGISNIRNNEDKAVKQTLMEKHPELRDKYNDRDKYRITDRQKQLSEFYLKGLSKEEKELLDGAYNYYEVKFNNKGGLVMPIILELKYVDGSSDVHYIPAEIWKQRADQVSKVFVSQKELKEIVLDPYLETADTDRSNNYFPARSQPTHFELYQGR
ncbi:M1 family metallopeptidase [Aureispira anguillae]|uniref:M1 family metallopeptidase n=1 Tax=Aureispira anguillae TaxID=2864201 RepID=A0A915YK68_9BACT|nr:M1 family metallopeptidase [Aureispira anguillae]BDS14431.1 M1 family metallopeptidase [Aureispira anguillae]